MFGIVLYCIIFTPVAQFTFSQAVFLFNLIQINLGQTGAALGRQEFCTSVAVHFFPESLYAMLKFTKWFVSNEEYHGVCGKNHKKYNIETFVEFRCNS